MVAAEEDPLIMIIKTMLVWEEFGMAVGMGHLIAAGDDLMYTMIAIMVVDMDGKCLCRLFLTFDVCNNKLFNYNVRSSNGHGRGGRGRGGRGGGRGRSPPVNFRHGNSGRGGRGIGGRGNQRSAHGRPPMNVHVDGRGGRGMGGRDGNNLQRNQRSAHGRPPIPMNVHVDGRGGNWAGRGGISNGGRGTGRGAGKCLLCLIEYIIIILYYTHHIASEQLLRWKNIRRNRYIQYTTNNKINQT